MINIYFGLREHKENWEHEIEMKKYPCLYEKENIKYYYLLEFMKIRLDFTIEIK